MQVKIKEIRADGLIVEILDRGNKGKLAYLPGEEYSNDEDEWGVARETLSVPEPGSTAESLERILGNYIDVLKIDAPPQPPAEMSVSRKQFGQEHIDQSWIGRPRVMIVGDLSPTFIRGMIGSVRAVMDRPAYQACFAKAELRPKQTDHLYLTKGDAIGGLVDAIEVKGGRERGTYIRLDPEGYLKAILKEIPSPGTRMAAAAVTAPSQPSPEDIEYRLLEDVPPPRFSPEVAEAISPLLFVENNDICRNSIRDFLIMAGAEVDAAGSVEEAREKLFGDSPCEDNDSPASVPKRYGMVIIDPNLAPEGNDGVGLLLAQEVQKKKDGRVVLCTAEEGGEKKNEFRELMIHGYYRKDEPIAELISEIELAARIEPKPLREWLDLESLSTQTPAPFQTVYDLDETTWEISIEQAIQELAAVMPETDVHVFSIHPGSFRAEHIRGVGDGLDWKPCRGKIGKSLINDAAFAGEPIFTDNSETPSEMKHLWTRKMMPYQSFGGLPVAVPGPMRHVLVAFHRDRSAFDDAFRTAARLCAERVGRALERERLRSRTEFEETFSSTGLALTALSHELHSDLMGVSGEAQTVYSLLFGEKDLTPDRRRKAKDIATQLRDDIEEIKLKTLSLRGVNIGAAPVSLVYCLRRAAIGCRSVLRDAMIPHPNRIAIKTPVPEEGNQWDVRAASNALVVVFFNLYLNAVQQIAQYYNVRRFGLVWHSLRRYVDDNGRPWAVVSIQDSGPGIHRHDWKRVFAAGYTTKEKGTGFGLHICRNLLSTSVESSRTPEIQVAQSVVWRGTSVSVKLPLVR